MIWRSRFPSGIEHLLFDCMLLQVGDREHAKKHEQVQALSKTCEELALKVEAGIQQLTADMG